MPNILTVGLGYGDEGKGTIVDFLVRHWGLRAIVRYNGANQAAHNIVSPEGIHHCCSQFGSGCMIPDVKTLISRFMLINPLSFIEEAIVLQPKISWAPSPLVYISKNCPVITPFQIVAGKLRESYRIYEGKQHGSCGKGVSEAVNDVSKYGEQCLFAGDLIDRKKTLGKLNFLRALQLDKIEQIPVISELDEHAGNWVLSTEIYDVDLADLANVYYDFVHGFTIVDDEFILEEINKGNVVFEGSQGVLLDPVYGHQPYVTPTRTTLENAEELLKQSGYSGDVRRIGILRGYATRHGAGPFVTEDQTLSDRIPPCRNKFNMWQGPFRLGWFDAVATRYALEKAGGIDYLAITNLDRLQNFERLNIATDYRIGNKVTGRLDSLNEIDAAKPFYRHFHGIPVNPDWSESCFIKGIETLVGRKVGIASFGETANNKKFI